MSSTGVSTKDALQGLWPVIRPFRWMMAAAILVAGGLTVLSMLPPLLMRPLINDVAAEGRWGIFPMLIGGLFVITVLRAVMTYFNARTIAFVGQRIVGRIRMRLFRHLISLPLRYHHRTSAGGLMQRIMGDVGAIQNLVTGHLVTLCVDLITAVFALTVLFQLNPRLTLFTLALMPVFYLNYRFWIGRIKLNNVQMRSEMDHVSSLTRTSRLVLPAEPPKSRSRMLPDWPGYTRGYLNSRANTRRLLGREESRWTQPLYSALPSPE